MNIIYKITDSAGINASSVTLFYSTNSTVTGADRYINGTAYNQFFNESGIINSNLGVGNFFFSLDHGDVYPTTANLDESYFENTTHSIITLNNNSAVSIQLLNISNSTDYNIFMFMANSSIGASPLFEFYMDNSSYLSGKIDADPDCYQIGTLNATQTFVDSEMSNQYQVLGLTINTATGMIGTVKVTPTSYFILRRGLGRGNWYVYYISQIARTAATQTTNNNGAGWAAQPYTVDAHIHQFYGAGDIFYYFACATDLAGSQNCSSVQQVSIGLDNLPPSVPHVYSPANSTYSGNIIIGYVQAISPNGYPVSYNISLLNYDGTLRDIIMSNNSQDLSYSWNSSYVPDGSYIIQVVATDSNGLSSYDLSEPFMTSNYQSSQNLYNSTLKQVQSLSEINQTLVGSIILVVLVAAVFIFLLLRIRMKKKKSKH